MPVVPSQWIEHRVYGLITDFEYKDLMMPGSTKSILRLTACSLVRETLLHKTWSRVTHNRKSITETSLLLKWNPVNKKYYFDIRPISYSCSTKILP